MPVISDVQVTDPEAELTVTAVAAGESVAVTEPDAELLAAAVPVRPSAVKVPAALLFEKKTLSPGPGADAPPAPPGPAADQCAVSDQLPDPPTQSRLAIDERRGGRRL